MDALVYNTNLEFVLLLDVYESFIWTDRYYEPGDFEIYVSANDQNALAIQKNYYIKIKDSDYCMIVEDIEVESDFDNGNKLKITGRSLESILDRRIIWSQTVLNGSLQNGVKRLLNENAINCSDVNRRFPNMIFEDSTDSNITSLTLQAEYTGDNLLETIQAICRAKDLGFSLKFNSSNQMVFKLYFGTDRSFNQTVNPYVIFSPKFENVLNSNYLESLKTYKNITLVAGEGEGTDRRTYVYTNESPTPSGLNRREYFTDARDISSNNGEISSSTYNNLLKQRGIEKLGENSETKTFEGQVEATKLFKLGSDFFMGDIVQTVSYIGTESRSRVIEIVRSYNNQGFTTYPTFKVLTNTGG